MKNFFKTEVTFVPSISCEDKDLKTEKLSRLLLSDTWKTQVEEVRNENDPAKRAELKKELPAFLPSGLFSSRKAGGLKKHSGFVCIDIDAKDNTEVSNFDSLKELMHQIPNVMYCGLSASGTGYFCLIPIKNPDKHTEYFRAIEQDFKRCGIRIDRKCVNVNRLRFVSYDNEPYINTAAAAYDYVIPHKDHPTAQIFGGEMTDEQTKERFATVLLEIESSKIDITGNYGQWFEILCAIASTFGEDGRESAHTISRQAECYDYEETEKQYSEILKRNYGYSIGTFFYHARNEIGKHDFDNLIELQNPNEEEESL